jgi:predicted metal-dependent phosphoesterase TrpH
VIDLHTHSTFSDGSLTPEALVDAAVEAGLSALALTDHDTTDGIPRFMAAAEAAGITGVPGVELSVDSASGTMHVLGYCVDLENADFQTALRLIRDGRERRNHKVLTALAALGMPLDWNTVAGLAGGDVVGRPHIAQAMIDTGYVSNKQVAFKQFLGKGLPAYVERFRFSSAEGIARIRNAGGIAVLAHPFTLRLKPKKLRACVTELKAEGLQGIETFYPEHSPILVQQYQKLACSLDLVMTGGSDFHGAGNPAIKIGRGFGNIHVTDGILDGLRERLAVTP